MGNLKALAEIARLGLPPGQHGKNLQQLAAWIGPGHLQEVWALVAVGAGFLPGIFLATVPAVVDGAGAFFFIKASFILFD